MILSKELLIELQKRLKIGNRRGVHLNAIPKNSSYKLDFSHLSIIEKDLPNQFLETLLSKKKFNFEVSWKDVDIDLFNTSATEQKKFGLLGKSFNNIFNQVEVIKAEKGIETFGFGFPLLIRRDKLDRKLTVAPLVIWQLELQRSKKNDTWNIVKNEDTAIYINEVLINHLISDSEIVIDQLAPVMLEDNILSQEELFEVCYDIVSKVNSGSKDRLEENLTNVFEKIVPILSEDKYNELALNDSNCLLQFSGLFSYFEIQKHNIIKDYDDLIKLAGEEISQEEMVDNPFQSITSITTDPTQQSVLNGIEKTRNMVIQGPPGTGKSQTLSALLVNALENRKKTIVVCEKNTALEILHRSLKDFGVGDHTVMIHDIVSNREEVVRSVRNRLDSLLPLSNKYGNAQFTYRNQIRSLQTLVEQANAKHIPLKDGILAKYNWTDIVGKYLQNLRETTGDVKSLNKNIKFDFSYDEFTDLEDLITKAEILFHSKGNNSQSYFLPEKAFNASSFFDLEARLNDSFYRYSQALTSINETISNLHASYVNVRKSSFHQQENAVQEKLTEVKNLKFDLRGEISLEKENYTRVENQRFANDASTYIHHKNRLKEVFDKYQVNSDFRNEEKVFGFGYQIQSIFSAEKKLLLKTLREFNLLMEELKSIVSNSSFVPKLVFDNTINSKLSVFKSFFDETEEIKLGFHRKANAEFDDLDLNYLTTLETKNQIIEHLELIDERPNLNTNQRLALDEIKKKVNEFFSKQNVKIDALKEVLKDSPDIECESNFETDALNNSTEINKIEKRIQDLSDGLKNKLDYEFLNADIFQDESKFSSFSEYNTLRNSVNELNKEIINDGFIKNFSPPQNINVYQKYIKNFIDAKNNYVNEDKVSFPADYKWFNLYNHLSENEKLIIDSLTEGDLWLNRFFLFYFDRLLRANATDLLPVDNMHIDQIFKKKEKLKQNQFEFINDIWYNEQLSKAKEFDSASDDGLKVKNLYNLKGSAGKRRYSLRYIIEKNIDLFTSFFPVILTTPDVASNLFKNNNRYFDLVVFDEASQLRLEDNLPAMLKGKQIVIAGDEHQMPPSNYFTKVFEGSIDSEDDIEDDDTDVKKDRSSLDALALSCISLLEFGTEMDFKTKSLDFHYRSKHPYLIEFSNHAFYKQKLVPLPNVLSYNPIKYVQVGGIFDKGINEKEAEMVLQILENNIKRKANGKYPTVGIATFNIKQRDLIQNKLLERQKQNKFKKFNDKITELESNGFFVKNLENIQGDERDVIILSTTYGNNEEGKFYERFGPLGFSKGYKLLNVIITRAKYKNYIVTSIPEERILNYKSYLVIQGTNYKKAPIFAYLAYAKAVSESNEELRKNVLQALTENDSSNYQSSDSNLSLLESPFEEEVYERLCIRGYREFIRPQEKVGGFRIDMVIDFGIIGLPKLAIECDGARYHSSSEAYLYDIHRQIILESQGYVFHRIWGTNWWRDPKEETDKLVSFIEEKRKPIVGDLYSDLDSKIHAFTDDIEISTIEIIPEELKSEETQEEIEELFENEEIEISEEPLIKVEMGSEVKIKYLRDNSIKNVKLVPKADESLSQSDNPMRVSPLNPLGKAIWHKSKGETCKFEDRDFFVEILEVI